MLERIFNRIGEIMAITGVFILTWSISALPGRLFQATKIINNPDPDASTIDAVYVVYQAYHLLTAIGIALLGIGMVVANWERIRQLKIVKKALVFITAIVALLMLYVTVNPK